jgi:PleD family two-component response regulator
MIVGVILGTRARRMGKIRVLLADDHDALLARVRSILCKEFEVVGTVDNGR